MNPCSTILFQGTTGPEVVKKSGVSTLDLRYVVPGGNIHVDREGEFYRVDLWLKELEVQGIDQVTMQEVMKQSNMANPHQSWTGFSFLFQLSHIFKES